ncbi:MAG: class I SAM-dependent methyltransferase [Terriglobia bacterium]
MSSGGSYDERAEFAEYYDHVPLYRERADRDFYTEQARASGGPVLELGCGTGRILLPMVRAGVDVTGLDSSQRMLARCRAKLSREPPEVQQRVELVQGSMTDFDLNKAFRLVAIPFRAFQHLLTVEEQLACLRGVHRHLRAGGRLILDVFYPNPQMLHDPLFHREAEDTPEQTLPDGRRLRRTTRIAAFHRARQVNDIEIIYHVTHPDGRRERLVQAASLRYFFRYELEHLLARASFRVTALYGDFDRSLLGDDSPEMIFITEKK